MSLNLILFLNHVQKIVYIIFSKRHTTVSIFSFRQYLSVRVTELKQHYPEVTIEHKFKKPLHSTHMWHEKGKYHGPL